MHLPDISNNLSIPKDKATTPAKPDKTLYRSNKKRDAFACLPNRLLFVDGPDRWSRKEAGFSLIEIIMVLVLVGVMGSVGTLGLTTFIKNFNTSRQGTDTTSAAQMAILRIAKELVAISEVNSSASETNGTKIRFTTIHEGATDRFFRIELTGTNINLIEYVDATTTTPLSTDLLVDNVAAFSLQYYDWISDNSTLSNTPTTTWSNDPCPTPFTLSAGDFERKYCDDASGDNRQRIRFDKDAANYSPPYILYYGGVEYGFCLENGDEYRVSDDTPVPADCDDAHHENIESDIPYYDSFYIYPASNPDCYNTYTLEQDPGDECTSIGDPADNLPSSIPGLSGSPDKSSLIEVNLQMDGLNEPFTISVAPRNL